jgi:hypothetical protein
VTCSKSGTSLTNQTVIIITTTIIIETLVKKLHIFLKFEDEGQKFKRYNTYCQSSLAGLAAILADHSHMAFLFPCHFQVPSLLLQIINYFMEHCHGLRILSVTNQEYGTT